MKSSSLSLLALAVAGSLFSNAGLAEAAPARHAARKDPVLVREDRILYWAHQHGELAANASEADKAAYLKRYLQGLRNDAVSPADRLLKKSLPARRAVAAKQANQKAATDKTVKVLTVLIDFPDLPYDNNRLSASATDMYYSDYNVAHYRDLMFSTTGYAGPSGQNLRSAYQYYQAESGQSLFFTGDVLPWVRADQNSDFYGSNVGDSGNDKDAPTLVKEAVAKAIAANPDFNLADYDVEDQYDLDGDENFNEPDGMIDHVMVFHSSVGEEAGGGVLRANAIWSHRWSVSNSPATAYTIPGTDYKVFGYTIQPIDAAAGVVVHEFGHDLGLPDEYDTARSDTGRGEPIGMWSVMSGGSWAGLIPGTEPVGFSPYARDQFQQWYGGNWINQTVLTLAGLQSADQQIDLTDAVDHDGAINQIRIDLPGSSTNAAAGDYLYASGHVDQSRRTLSFDVAVPNNDNARLQLQAQWQIEQDYDYARVLVNGTAIAGSQTRNGSNPQHPEINRYLTGNSASGWQALTFPLTDYKGSTVTITIEYVTDPSVGGYGILIDQISVNDGASTAFSSGAETDGELTRQGFSRVTSAKTQQDQNYYLQLRSHRGIDGGLQREQYDHGVVLWFADQNFSDNNVESHPGQGFLGVVDADQVLMRSGSAILDSQQQVRDAAFRRMTQTSKSNDGNLTAIYSFDDRYDYSSPDSPQSGLVLPDNKLVMSVLDQAADSRTARIFLSANPATAPLTATIAQTVTDKTVSFSATASGGTGALNYAWNFGDGATSTDSNPSHSYASTGNYPITLTVTDSNGVARTVTGSVSIGRSTGGGSGGGGGGGGGSSPIWLLLALAGLTGSRRR